MMNAAMMKEAMTPLERVVAAIEHREPDRVPVYPLLNGCNRRLIHASYPDWSLKPEVAFEGYVRATEQFQVDVICTLIDLSVEAADFGQTILYPENEAAHPDYKQCLIRDMEDYAKLEPIDLPPQGRMMKAVQLNDMLVRRMGKEYPVVAFVFGPMGTLSMMRGQSNLYMDLVDDPDAVHQGLRAVTDTLKKYIDRLISTGVSAIMLDTLFSSRSILSKRMWKAFEYDYVKELADYILARGCMTMIHNCGEGIYFDVQIESIRPSAISFQHLPDDCTSPQELKQKYGDKTCFIGCIEPTWAPFAPEEELRAEIRRQIDVYAPGGGFILATGCEYSANADFRAAQIMVEEAKTYGRYR